MARIRLRSGDAGWQAVALDELSAFASEGGNPENTKGVLAAEVFVDRPLLASGMCLVDTPGLESIVEGNSVATRAFIPQVDAAIVVIGADPPLSGDECMGRLERWLHDKPVRTPPLAKATLSHLQFETIHPFLDGNGRVGRLLVTLLLCAEGALLYVSLHLKQHRDEYYALLDSVRRDGDWEAWLSLFAEGVRASAAAAVVTAQRLANQAREDAGRISGIKRLAGSALHIHKVLQQRPLASAAQLSAHIGVSLRAVNSALAALGELGVVREITRKRRGRRSPTLTI